jgi:hypothetical protein
MGSGFIREFFTRPWFRRTWTMQEVVLPRGSTNLQLLTDRGLLPYVKFIDAAAACQDEWDDHIATDADMLDIYRNFLYQMSAAERRQKYGNYDTFSEVRRKECSDPKDKVFGLAGIIRTLYGSFLAPDYSRSIVDIYTDAAEWIMVKMGHLKMLYYAFSPPEMLTKSQLGLDKHRLPSWVPDFTIPLPRKKTGMTFSHRFSFNTTRGSAAKCEVMTGRRHLRVYGKLLGSIRHVGHVMIEFHQRIFRENHTVSFLKPAFDVMVSWFALLGSDVEIIRNVFVDVVAAWSVSTLDPEDARCWIEEMVESVQHRMDYIYPSRSAELSNQRGLDPSGLGLPLFLTQVDDEERIRVHTSFMHFCHLLEGWRCFVTGDGAIGFGDGGIHADDRIALISGVDFALVLRNAGGGHWRLVGRAYVQGLMNGEGWPSREEDLEEIVLS